MNLYIYIFIYLFILNQLYSTKNNLKSDMENTQIHYQAC